MASKNKILFREWVVILIVISAIGAVCAYSYFASRWADRKLIPLNSIVLNTP